MNDKSSRSHSVFTIMLTQSSQEEGEEMSKVSRINLIDLAGSERSSVAMTSGERLKVRGRGWEGRGGGGRRMRDGRGGGGRGMREGRRGGGRRNGNRQYIAGTYVV